MGGQGPPGHSREALRGIRSPGPYLRAFWQRAYREGITGLAAMVAYNLLLSLFPFTLLMLFIFGQVLESGSVEEAVLLDLQRLFPDVEQSTLQNALDRIRSSSATFGIVAAVAGIWIGTSFWGAMDTAFCRIYHVQCRGWIEQRRWALGMLIVVALFLAASVVVPTLETLLVTSADDLPFGLDDTGWVLSTMFVFGALGATFLVGCLIYWFVPKGYVPWRAIWPGAFFLASGLGLLNWVFPLYLDNLSTTAGVGNTVGFVLIALIWFYAISLGLMAGAVINAMRFEAMDAGTSVAAPIPDEAD